MATPSESADYALALRLQGELCKPKNSTASQYKRRRSKSPAKWRAVIPTHTMSLVDETYELIDPTPDIYQLFRDFDKHFFWSKLGGVELKWSPQMTRCAGVCSYQPRSGLCSVRLSKPLLTLRPRRDLVETLLHEMIHALLFVTHCSDNREEHGPQFHRHMRRINGIAGTNITVYHSFHAECASLLTHWWRCTGACRSRRPYFGFVKRARNRAPGPNDFWWSTHRMTCGGTFEKIKEPAGYGQKKTKKQVPAADPTQPDIRNFMATGAGGGGGSDVTTPSQKRKSPSASTAGPGKRPSSSATGSKTGAAGGKRNGTSTGVRGGTSTGVRANGSLTNTIGGSAGKTGSSRNTAGKTRSGGGKKKTGSPGKTGAKTCKTPGDGTGSAEGGSRNTKTPPNTPCTPVSSSPVKSGGVVPRASPPRRPIATVRGGDASPTVGTIHNNIHGFQSGVAARPGAGSSAGAGRSFTGRGNVLGGSSSVPWYKRDPPVTPAAATSAQPTAPTSSGPSRVAAPPPTGIFTPASPPGGAASGAGRPPPEKVACPVCGLQVALATVNDHVDWCLTAAADDMLRQDMDDAEEERLLDSVTDAAENWWDDEGDGEQSRPGGVECDGCGRDGIKQEVVDGGCHAAPGIAVKQEPGRISPLPSTSKADPLASDAIKPTVEPRWESADDDDDELLMQVADELESSLADDVFTATGGEDPRPNPRAVSPSYDDIYQCSGTGPARGHAGAAADCDNDPIVISDDEEDYATQRAALPDSVKAFIKIEDSDDDLYDGLD